MNYRKYQKWIKIANSVRYIRLQIYDDLIPSLKNVPKSVYNKQLDKFLRDFEKIRSDLEDRFRKECPEQFNTNVFYGDYKKPVAGNLIRCPYCKRRYKIKTKEDEILLKEFSKVLDIDLLEINRKDKP